MELQLDGQILDLGTRKQRALLALLVINRRRTVSSDHIITALWGADAPSKRREDVWVYVSRIRRMLDPADEVLRREPGGYLLDIEETSVDAARFENLVNEGQRLLPEDPAAASLVLGEALSAWSGRAFEEFDTEDFAAAETTRLEESRLTALEMRIEADLAWRDTGHLIPEIEGLVTAYPLRANLTGCLMVALYRKGRQADALRTYSRFASRLGDEVGLEPPEHLKILEGEILLDNPALLPGAPDSLARLPEPIASFVGRETELSDITGLLDDHRLVVLTGPGGVGKSALALEAARRLALSHDSLALVDLTRAEQSGDILAVAAEALRVQHAAGDALNSILRRLADRRTLLVFDNCEPVAAQAAQAVVSLLQGAPGLRVIATSRVVLGIPGEPIIRLTPLSTVHNGDAERLLTARTSALPSASRNVIDAEAFHALCVKTGGLPLAVELAAAQLGTWSIEEVIEAMDRPLEALTFSDRIGPDHHRDMRANIAWSERLLPEETSMLLARLSVFRSSFAFAAVGPVAGFEPLAGDKVRHEMRRLVDASMVIARTGSPTRYHLLEPVRHYATRRLADLGESTVVAERHAIYFEEHFESLSRSIGFETDPNALRRARPDDENLLAALWWAITDDSARAANIAAVAIPFWRATGKIAEVLPAITAALEVSNIPKRTRAELLFRSAPLYQLDRAPAASREHLAELEAIARTVDDPEVSAWAALRRADAMTDNTDADEVIAVYNRAIESLRNAESEDITMALHNLGWYLYWCWNRVDEVEALVAQWMEVETSVERSDALSLSGWLALARGEPAGAARTITQVSTEYRRQGDHRMAALQMLPLSISSFQSGEVAEALRRIDVAVTASRETGAIPWLRNALMTRAYVHLAIQDHHAAAQDLIEVIETTGPVAGSDIAARLAHATASTLAVSDPEVAAALLAAAESLPGVQGMSRLTQLLVVPAFEKLVGSTESHLRNSLASEAFEPAWARGSAMDDIATVMLAHTSLNEALKAAR
jgi:predicted ATPase/DNA-binding SARP family transcriptional activator